MKIINLIIGNNRVTVNIYKYAWFFGIEAGNKFLPKNAFNYIIKNNNGGRVSK